MSSRALMQPEVAAYAERDVLGPDATDAALVAAVREGEDRAFEQLFARYQRRITAYVQGMVSDHGRAEDITQEIFMSALRRMRETERPIAFRPWIYEIAKNACIDQFRRTKRAREVSYDATDELGAADHVRLVHSGPTPDAVVAQKQALQDLQGAFGGLSATHHQILVLRELEGLSYREIGQRLDMSAASVESTLFRARRRLSEEYQDLTSGRSCERVQHLLAAAPSEGLGARDARRLGRHLSHCRPCRMQARAAGVDAAAVARRPGRRAELGAKIAGLLPFPALLRWRRPHGEDLVVQWSAMGGPAAEPVVVGWTKAATAAATVVLAGVGAGVGSKVTALPDRPEGRTPVAAAERRAAAPGASEARPFSLPGSERLTQLIAPATARFEPRAAAPPRPERTAAGPPAVAVLAPTANAPAAAAPVVAPVPMAEEPESAVSGEGAPDVSLPPDFDSTGEAPVVASPGTDQAPAEPPAGSSPASQEPVPEPALPVDGAGQADGGAGSDAVGVVDGGIPDSTGESVEVPGDGGGGAVGDVTGTAGDVVDTAGDATGTVDGGP